MTKEKKETRSDEEILFPEVIIEGITIKPWSFGALFELSDSLDKVLDKVEEKKLADEIESGFLSNITLARLFTIANKEVLHIMAYTTECSEDEIRALDMTIGLQIAVIIFNQNRETIVGALKNALSSPTKKMKKSKKEEEKGGEQNR